MPHFELFDLVKWLHFISFTVAGGAAVVALLISGLEDEREDLKGLSATLWKWVVAWGFRAALVTGGILLAMKLSRGGHPFDAYYLHLKLILVFLLLVMSELSPKALALAKRGAALIAVLMFLLATFVVFNQAAFGRKVRPPAEVSAGPQG
jgi:uncharacterized membrane protein